MEGVMAAVPAQLGRKEWRVVAESSVGGRGDNARVFPFVDGGINDSSSSRRAGIRSNCRSNTSNNSSSSSINNNGMNNSNNGNGSRNFHSGGSSEHSSDSDHLMGESGPSNLMVGIGGGGLASPRQDMGQPDDATIYEIKHVQQANGHLDTDLGSISIQSGLSNSEESLQQRLHDIARQREQLQQLEIDLRAQFIARTETMRIQNDFEDQTKQHASIVANFQEQLEQRDHHIRDLEQQLEERQRQLCMNQMETNEAVSQVWAKDGLLREQNNELVTLRRECETAMSEQKAAAARLEAERAQHISEKEDLNQQLNEKERQIHEMEEQRRTAEEMLLYKEDQLREAQAWISRIQEIDAIHLNSSHNLQVELRDRTDQFNQLWLGCQRQLADTERYYLQNIQHLQMELAEAREQSQACKDGTGLNHIDSNEKKLPYSENNGVGQYDVNGDVASKANKNGSTVVMNNQSKVGMMPNGNVDGAVPLVLVRDVPPKADHAAGLPIAPSPVFGMNALLPSDPMGMMHQFGMHQQSIPQTLQPSAVQVSPPPCGQFQSMPTILPPHQLMSPQHQQALQQTNQYIHHNQPSQVQRFPIRQQPHANYQVNVKSQGLHSKHQDLQTHSQLDQSDGDIVNMQKEQQAQISKEEVQEKNLSSILKQEYGDHNSQTQEASGLQLDQACQQDTENRRLDQQHLPSFPQHQIQQQKADLGAQDMQYETQHLAHSQTKSMNVDQLGPISRASVSASPSQSFGGSNHFQQDVPDCKLPETADIQTSALQSPQKSATLDGYGKTSDPVLLDERSLLACFVRAIPAEASARIRISTTLPNRLGKMLAPLHWHDYKKKYGRLDEFVASHPELFLIEGDFIHLREGAHATISATTAVAKVAAAAAAAASPLGTARMPTIAVTPVAQSQVHRLKKGMLINPKDVKGSSLDVSAMVQNTYANLHGGTLKQTQALASRTSAGNGSVDQNPEVTHSGIETSSTSSKGDASQADGLSINSRLDGLTLNSNATIVGNFDKAVTNGYKSTGASNGRIGMSFGRQGRFLGSVSYIKQDFANRPQTQESHITRVDGPTASIR